MKRWLRETEFADRAELPWLKDDEPLWDAISATSDQCLGSECIHIEDCYLNTLRRRAAQAGIIIVNHHLFFADLMVKKGGFGEIIPRFQVAVFDEAHNIEDIATTYFGVRLGTGQLLELVKDVDKAIKEIRGKNKGDINNHLNLIRNGTERLQRLFIDSDDKGRLDEEIRMMIDQDSALDIRKGLNYIRQRAGLKEYMDISFQALAARAGELEQSLEKIFSYNDPDWLNWYEKRKKGMTFHSSPLDVSRSMRELLYDKVKTIIFTSATLSTNQRFDYIRSRLGLPENTLEGIYPSHFNFKKQALMYIPKDLPLPKDPDFGLKVAKRIIDILKLTSGRALILFTSYHNLNLVHQQLNKKNLSHCYLRFFHSTYQINDLIFASEKLQSPVSVLV